MKAAYEYDGPVYLRFGRLAVPVIFDENDFKFEIGKGKLLREGKNVTLIATGLMVNEALGAAEILSASGIDCEVIDIATIKPIDRDIIVNSARKTGKVVTVEEHSIVGGLGSAVAEVLSEECPTKLKRIGIYDRFGFSGPANNLLKEFGLTKEPVAEAVSAFVRG